MPLMTDTEMKDDWIARVLADNPCKLLDNGNVRTCPVRLAFVSLKQQVRLAHLLQPVIRPS